MFSVTKEIFFCYGHRLLNYAGKCKNLHGHNGKAVITVETPALDGLGMVVDFTEIKKVIGAWIDETLDHKMILHRDDPVLPELRAPGRTGGGDRREPHRREHRQADLRPRRLARPAGEGGDAVGNRDLVRDLPGGLK